MDVDELATLRYVGIGGDQKRWKSHLKRSHNDRLRNKIRKLSRSGITMPHVILQFGLTLEEAWKEERRLIALHGRAGIEPNGVLYNRTAGGEGAFGLVHTEETKRKIAAGNTGKIFSSERRERIGEAKRGSAHSAESKRQMSLSHMGAKPWNKGITLSEEDRKKMSQARVGKPGRPWTEEQRRRHSEIMRGAGPPREACIKGGLARRGKQLTQAHRKAISDARRGRPHPHVGSPCSPEKREKISKSKAAKRASTTP